MNNSGLTLDGFTGKQIRYTGSAPLEVEVNGTNTITAEEESTAFYVQHDYYASDSVVNFSGNGTLNLKMPSGDAEALYVNGKIDVSDVTMNIESGGNCAICTYDFILNNGNVSVTFTGDFGDTAFLIANSLSIEDGKMIAINQGELSGPAIGNNGGEEPTFINKIAGVGYTNADGTEGKTMIPAGTRGKDFYETFKHVEFPYTPEITPPAPKIGLTENGNPQDLITAGKTSDGTMQYAIGTDDKTAPTDGWAESIPTGKEAKTYYVWYKVIDADRKDTVKPACIIVEIKTASSGNDETKDNKGNNGDIIVNEGSGSTAVSDVQLSEGSGTVLKEYASKRGAGMDARLEVTPQAESAVGAEVVSRIAEKITEAFSGKDAKREFLDMSIFLSNDGFASDRNRMDSVDVGGVLEIIVTYDLNGKEDAKIIRDHDGNTKVLTVLNERATGDLSDKEGSFFVDKANNRIYIYAQYFSTYSIAYTTGAGSSGAAPQNNSGSSSGSSGPKWVGLLPSGAGILSPNDAPAMQGAGGTVAQGTLGTADPSVTAVDPAASAAGAQSAGKSASASNGKQVVASPKTGDANADIAGYVLLLCAAALIAAGYLCRTTTGNAD